MVMGTGLPLTTRLLFAFHLSRSVVFLFIALSLLYACCNRHDCGGHLPGFICCQVGVAKSELHLYFVFHRRGSF